MKVSKSQLSAGVIDFFQNEVVKNVPDNGLKIVLGTVLYSMKRDSKIMNKYVFENPFISMLLNEENETYDVDALCNDLSTAIKEYGNLTFTIPNIPLLSSGEKTISFTASDAQNLRAYVERAGMA